MNRPAISTIADLHTALQEAVALEFATVPPYLCGAWTIKDGSSPIVPLVRDIVVAEMRHMAIAANTLIATGGTPDIKAAVPSYPAYLPDGRDEFEVSLVPFGAAFLQQSMWIEQPTSVQSVPASVLARFAAGNPPRRNHRLMGMGDIFPTIGQFYAAIIAGIQTLVAQLGEAAVLPNGGNPGNQTETFGGILVTSSAEAVILLNDIVDEGEGSSGAMWDENRALSHYYTFQEISLGRAYQPGDRPGQPSGDPIDMPRSADIVPMVTNPKMSDYPQGSAVANDARAFNQAFTQVVADLATGFNGQPDDVTTAVNDMFALPSAAAAVLGNDAPNHPGMVAGPTFEITGP